jgi:hypothetical protein
MRDVEHEMAWGWATTPSCPALRRHAALTERGRPASGVEREVEGAFGVVEDVRTTDGRGSVPSAGHRDLALIGQLITRCFAGA